MNLAEGAYQLLLDKLGNLPEQPDQPEETADATLRALWHLAAGRPLSAQQAVAVPLPELDARATHLLEELIQRRLQGEPLAHITGRQSFLGMEMLVGRGALVPRKETEILARTAVQLAGELGGGALNVIDTCTGAGNVALAVAWHVPGAHVHGTDISPEAISVARRNACHLGLDERVSFACADLLAPPGNAARARDVDLVTCNPPYISSGKVDQRLAGNAPHEPRLAFDGGPFGVSVLMRLLVEAPRVLRSGGWLAFEVGLGQGPALTRRLESSGDFTSIRAVTDADGNIRVLAARTRIATDGQ